MTENLTEKLRDFIKPDPMIGKEFDIDYLRRELKIDPDSPAYEGIRTIVHRLVDEKLLRSTGKRSGTYRVVRPVQSIQVFGEARDRKPPFEIAFPCDRDTKEEMSFAESIVLRPGDIIMIGGVSNYGKTTLSMNFLGENVDKHPQLLGNEFSTVGLEPSPRFLNRLEAMDWVKWTNGDGKDKFTLWPVFDDYAENIVPDCINIVDWVDVSTASLYDIKDLMLAMKRAVGDGILVIVLQKGENAAAARGGQFTKDFTDCEILLDPFGEHGVLLTLGKVKEIKKGHRSVVGKHYAYNIEDGVRIVNFREVKKCMSCKGHGNIRGATCFTCKGTGWMDNEPL